MAIPKFKREYIIEALKYIDENGVPSHNQSTKYELVTEDGKRYPPKYVVAVDHILRTPADNKTIGLLICKTKDNVFAQYALEGSNQPLGISEYELSKLYPEKVEGTIPSIEEIEARLGEMTKEQTNEHS